jgi:hypothetical protein
MNRILVMVILAIAACGGGNNSSGADGGGRGGSGSGNKSNLALGDNASVPETCQTCLATSSTNECESQGTICGADSECVALDKCINNCANINAACISSCGDAASANAIAEWNNWSNCTCGTCAMQCNQTFCNIGGSGTGSNTGACIADNNSCSTTEACCTFCASDGYCGCIPSGNDGCASNSDCCSGFCGGGGTCQ